MDRVRNINNVGFSIEKESSQEENDSEYIGLVINAYKLLEKKILGQKRYLEKMGVSVEDDILRLYEARTIIGELESQRLSRSIEQYFDNYQRMICDQSKRYKAKLLDYAINKDNG